MPLRAALLCLCKASPPRMAFQRLFPGGLTASHAATLPACRQGALSEAGAAACRQLRSLEPAEAAGVVCWLLDELATGGLAGWLAG